MESAENEIDPKLFMLCRLCLEEMGVYQIVPRIREQIKFSFDIVVEPYDGYSQLICKSCNLLVNEYSTLKKKFIEKQNVMMKNYVLNKDDDPAPKNQSVDLNQSQESDSENNLLKDLNKVSKYKRRNRLLSSSSTTSVESTQVTKKKRKPNLNNVTTLPADLRKKYVQHFACRYCSKTFLKKNSVSKHCKKSHIDIRSRHHAILVNKCKVNLQKIDNKPNATGLTNTVVLSKNKIIQDNGDQLYYLAYLAHKSPDPRNDNFKNENYNNNSDSSDNVAIGNIQRKRIRLDSRSSNETVFIGDCNTGVKKSNIKSDVNKQLDSKDTICIDDSSDSDIDSNSKKQENIEKVAEVKIDLKVIKEIISVCRKKYEAKKRLQVSENDDKRQVESQLKHKVLSIGRKVINRKSFNNCTGLLRYLEHKNLDVMWEGKSSIRASISKEASFVRMAIKNIKKSSDNSRWIDVDQLTDPLNTHNTMSIDTFSFILPNTQETQIVQKPQVMTQSVNMQQLTVVQFEQQPPIVQQPQVLLQSSQTLQQTCQAEQSELTDHAVLYANIVDDTNTKKLLNSTPVANPKQLPKKTYVNDTKTLVVNATRPDIDESNIVLPVITSTTSLAEVKKDETKSKSKDVNVSSTVNKPAPRIKVKPVSELMKPSSIINNAIVNQPNIWGFNQVQNDVVVNENAANIFVPNNLMSQIQSQSAPLPGATMPMSNIPPVEKNTSEENKSTPECIILDTVDFPNTKTDSPFKYFRNLLLLHDIILTETNAPLTHDFVCLLKFKVQFKQENKNLTLCLSLFCSDNKFCMCVKDCNLINIHIAKMSANWQWEIMKVYQGDVTNKILQNALKAGPNIYSKTKTFLYLLKSINQKQTE